MLKNPWNKPHILVTNDDGIDSPGLKILCDALATLAHITIVAPALEQSGVGVSITIRDPIHASAFPWANGIKAWKVHGTPADCVKIGAASLMDRTPDLVISGINAGSNHGRSFYSSGTVGATIEAAIKGIQAIAFSADSFHNPRYDELALFIPSIVSYLLNHPLPKETLLNVNYPDLPADEIKGMKLSTQGKRYWSDQFEKRNHPASGTPYYWMGCCLSDHEEHPDSDTVGMEQGYITAVPINVSDLTHHEELLKRKSHFESLFDRVNLKTSTKI